MSYAPPLEELASKRTEEASKAPERASSVSALRADPPPPKEED
jgi:hypothetical protein